MVVEELLILQRGGQVRGGCGGGATATEIVAAVLPLSPQEEDPDRWVPLSGSSLFLFPFSKPAGFRDLFGASNHFLKFCKDSSGVQLTCRAYPKIGAAI